VAKQAREVETIKQQHEIDALKAQVAALQEQLVIVTACKKVSDQKYEKLADSVRGSYLVLLRDENKSADTGCLAGQWDMDRHEEDSEEESSEEVNGSGEGALSVLASDAFSVTDFKAFSQLPDPVSLPASRRGGRRSGSPGPGAADSDSLAAESSARQPRTKRAKTVEQALARMASPTLPATALRVAWDEHAQGDATAVVWPSSQGSRSGGARRSASVKREKSRS